MVSTIQRCARCWGRFVGSGVLGELCSVCAGLDPKIRVPLKYTDTKISDPVPEGIVEPKKDRQREE